MLGKNGGRRFSHILNFGLREPEKSAAGIGEGIFTSIN